MTTIYRGGDKYWPPNKITCPRCGAKPGERCLDTRLTPFHRERWDAAPINRPIFIPEKLSPILKVPDNGKVLRGYKHEANWVSGNCKANRCNACTSVRCTHWCHSRNMK